MRSMCTSISCATVPPGPRRTTWRRETDRRAGGKSPFQFDVPGSVAKSTHAGLPWLRYMREELGARVHWWPFDGCVIAAGRSVVAEVYPALCAAYRPDEPMNGHQQDAYAAAAWLRALDARTSVTSAAAA